MNRILLIFLIFSLSIKPLSSAHYLVSVGISDYPGTDHDLKNSDKDARDFVELFLKNHVAGQFVLLDNNLATKKNILEQMNHLFAKAGKDDVVIFYFSGHGMNECFVPYDASKTNMLTVEDLRKEISKCAAKRKILIADACFAGAFRISPPKEQNQTVPTSTDAELLFFLSSRSNQTSIDGGKIENGLFTYHLVRGLKGGADTNKDRLITAKELFDFVYPRVKEQSKEKQIPVMWGKFSNEMVIMDWRLK